MQILADLNKMDNNVTQGQLSGLSGHHFDADDGSFQRGGACEIIRTACAHRHLVANCIRLEIMRLANPNKTVAHPHDECFYFRCWKTKEQNTADYNIHSSIFIY